MILLWGVPGDPPFDAVYAGLGRIGAPVRLLDQRHAAKMQIDLVVASSGALAGHITDGEGEIDLDQVGATYIRPYETRKACGINTPDDPLFLRAAMADSALIVWSDLSPTPVVNRPALMATNNSKPYQLNLIASFGFAVPDTLVTTDQAAVRRFHERHGTVIYKSVSGIRSIVSRLDEEKYAVVADVANCPTQFQQYVPGVDIRVHVVGETVIATQIASPASDYRYASRTGADLTLEPVALPSKVAEKCRIMAREMRLHVAGIDFRRTPEDAWYCLEVNPSPGFTFFEAATGQPIAAAVADLLLRLDRSALPVPPRHSGRRGSRGKGR